ncbi:unnamed protein product, partial [Meganyctiphanes norvegica]
MIYEKLLSLGIICFGGMSSCVAGPDKVSEGALHLCMVARGPGRRFVRAWHIDGGKRACRNCKVSSGPSTEEKVNRIWEKLFWHRDDREVVMCAAGANIIYNGCKYHCFGYHILYSDGSILISLQPDHLFMRYNECRVESWLQNFGNFYEGGILPLLEQIWTIPVIRSRTAVFFFFWGIFVKSAYWRCLDIHIIDLMDVGYKGVFAHAVARKWRRVTRYDFYESDSLWRNAFYDSLWRNAFYKSDSLWRNSFYGSITAWLELPNGPYVWVAKVFVYLVSHKSLATNETFLEYQDTLQGRIVVLFFFTSTCTVDNQVDYREIQIKQKVLTGSNTDDCKNHGPLKPPMVTEAKSNLCYSSLRQGRVQQKKLGGGISEAGWCFTDPNKSLRQMALKSEKLGLTSLLSEFVNAERQNATIYPPAEQVYSWTQYCKLEDVKVVILGQDPYHGPKQAHGLCFSVQIGVPAPPSLKNMYKELETDIEGFTIPDHGHLVGWATQAVLSHFVNLVLFRWPPFFQKDLGVGKEIIAFLNNFIENSRGINFWANFDQCQNQTAAKPQHFVFNANQLSDLGGFGRGDSPWSHYAQCYCIIKLRNYDGYPVGENTCAIETRIFEVNSDNINCAAFRAKELCKLSSETF